LQSDGFGIFRDKAFDLEVLLEPFEEGLDLPTAAIEGGDIVC
jgi:hypothetical protein